jgi:tripartite-type tricarboxylate transporter receptor subunit TctC
MRRVPKCVVWVLALGLATPVLAQDGYPNRPIRLVAPSPPAGVHDVVARLWAERIKPHLGQVVVENRPGVGGSIGAAEVTRAAPRRLYAAARQHQHADRLSDHRGDAAL